MFELERLKNGVKYKYGAKGQWTQIDKAKTLGMQKNALGLLYRVNIPDVFDIYVGLNALSMDPKLMKLKVVRGMVTEQVYDRSTVELPPEGEPGAEA